MDRHGISEIKLILFIEIKQQFIIYSQFKMGFIFLMKISLTLPPTSGVNPTNSSKNNYQKSYQYILKNLPNELRTS